MTQNQDTPSYELIKNLKFCVFDLETTGGNHKTDKIIEVGMVKIENLEITDRKDFLISPEIKIPEFIQRLTNISQKDVKDSPIIEERIEEILKFMGDSILVAHNVSFDVPFLNSVLTRLGRDELKNNTLCTNLMTKYLIPNLMNSNLNYMSKIFDIRHHKAHRALDDAEAAAHLLLKYLHIFAQKDIRKVNNLYYPRNRYELDRANFKKSDSLKDIENKLSSLKSPALITLKGENGIILFSVPFQGSSNDFELIMNKVSQLNWENLTIKLYGPTIESLIHLNTLYTKLETPIRDEILNYLWEEYLPKIDEDKRKSNQYKNDAELELNEYDFLITHHLVPEQFIIYPLKSLHPRSQLIFRYPGHKKKLLQYINSQSGKIKSNKLKKIHTHPHLKSFIDSYLIEKGQEKKEYFLFSRKLAQKTPENFYQQLEGYIESTPNPYNYPKEYI